MLRATKTLMIWIALMLVGSAGSTQFADVDDDDWYREDLDKLVGLGAVSGYPSASGAVYFSPNRLVTRAEFLKLCLHVLSRGPGLTASPVFPAPGQAPFPDVPISAWYAGHAAFAKRCGITEVGQVHFEPDASVTREAAVSFVMRTLELNGGARAEDPLLLFQDTSAPDIINARSAKIVSGHIDGLFHPNLSLTRAEAVALVARAFKNLESPSPVAFDMTAFTSPNPLIPEVALNDACASVGIRLNRPDNGANLVRVSAELGPPSAGTYYELRRSSNSIKVWPLRDKSLTPYLGDNDSLILAPSALSFINLYVENIADTSQSEATLSLALRRTQDGATLSIQKIRFKSFDHAVVVLSGERYLGSPSVSPNESIGRVGGILHDRGYDVYLYDEDEVESDGTGEVFDALFDAIVQRGVNRLAIIGFSHGGGSVHDLATKLDGDNRLEGLYTIGFSAYLDAIQQQVPIAWPETRYPPGPVAFHLNIYQQNNDTCFDLSGASVADSSVEINVTNTDWGAGLDHCTIDDNSFVQEFIATTLEAHFKL